MTNESLPITFLQFKYILNNFNNKSVNIHSLIEDLNTEIPSLMELLDQIRKVASNRSLKTRLTKLSNLIFQATPSHLNTPRNKIHLINNSFKKTNTFNV